MEWRGWGAYTELPQPARLGSLAWPDGAPAHSSPTMLRLIHSRNLYVLKPKPIQNCLKFQTGQSSSWACSWAVHPPPPVASQALGKCAAHTWPLGSAPVLAWPSPQQPRARVIGTGRGGGDGLSQWSVSQAFRPKGRSCAPPVLKKFREVSLSRDGSMGSLHDGKGCPGLIPGVTGPGEAGQTPRERWGGVCLGHGQEELGLRQVGQGTLQAEQAPWWCLAEGTRTEVGAAGVEGSLERPGQLNWTYGRCGVVREDGEGSRGAVHSPGVLDGVLGDQQAFQGRLSGRVWAAGWMGWRPGRGRWKRQDTEVMPSAPAS